MAISLFSFTSIPLPMLWINSSYFFGNFVPSCVFLFLHPDALFVQWLL